jgi:TDG/mug DNA glycosylase family protein
MTIIRPTKEDLLSARGGSVPDQIAPGLKLLFCGINPGLYSAAVSHHFARPGNRFWKVLFQAGFTNRQIAPSEETELLTLGYGITNIVDFATAQASELSLQMLQAGAALLEKKVAEFYPKVVAVLGIDAFRKAFSRPDATVGPQVERLSETEVWVMPSPSGINASYQMADLVRIFAELKRRIGEP